jgi:phage-related baseplate assembly protein
VWICANELESDASDTSRVGLHTDSITKHGEYCAYRFKYEGRDGPVDDCSVASQRATNDNIHALERLFGEASPEKDSGVVWKKRQVLCEDLWDEVNGDK